MRRTVSLRSGFLRSASLRYAWRRFTLGSGPLKRRSDRIELLSRIVLLLALVAAAPLGVVAGSAVADGLDTTAHQQLLARVQERATLLSDATLDPQASSMQVPTEATWLGPDGATHVGRVPAPAGLPAGSTVAVWVDRSSGRPVDPPLTDAVITDQSLVAGAVTFLGTVIAALSIHLVVLAVLSRRRARRWEAGWQQVEPLWISRFW